MGLLDVPGISRAQFAIGRRRDTATAERVFGVSASATIGSVATATAITSGVSYGPWTYTSFSGDWFNYRRGGAPALLGSAFPDYQYIKFTSRNSANSFTADYSIDVLHQGTAMEFVFKDVPGGNIRVRVDGVLVSTTPYSNSTSSGGMRYLPISFPTSKLRRVTFDVQSLPWNGIIVGPADILMRPTRAVSRGPRTIVLGDSFTEGTGATGGSTNNWVMTMADKLGWSDVWPSGSGGTGFLNPGAGGRVTFRGRVATDVIAWNPDIVIVAGGRNDLSSSASAVQAEALLLFQQIKTALPNARLIVLSPFWAGGVETWGGTIIGIRDAIKAAAATAGADAFIDTLERPLISAPIAGTLQVASTTGYGTVGASVPIPVRSTLEIGSGLTTVERRVVKAVSGSGPYTHTVSNLSNAHAVGETVKQVGAALFTGTGNTSTAANNGNGDITVSGDGVHPAQAGHDMIGLIVAAELEALLMSA